MMINIHIIIVHEYASMHACEEKEVWFVIIYQDFCFVVVTYLIK